MKESRDMTEEINRCNQAQELESVTNKTEEETSIKTIIYRRKQLIWQIDKVTSLLAIIEKQAKNEEMLFNIQQINLIISSLDLTKSHLISLVYKLEKSTHEEK